MNEMSELNETTRVTRIWILTTAQAARTCVNEGVTVTVAGKEIKHRTGYCPARLPPLVRRQFLNPALVLEDDLAYLVLDLEKVLVHCEDTLVVSVPGMSGFSLKTCLYLVPEFKHGEVLWPRGALAG
jgi:hypothetical protein